MAASNSATSVPAARNAPHWLEKLQTVRWTGVGLWNAVSENLRKHVGKATDASAQRRDVGRLRGAAPQRTAIDTGLISAIGAPLAELFAKAFKEQ